MTGPPSPYSGSRSASRPRILFSPLPSRAARPWDGEPAPHPAGSGTADHRWQFLVAGAFDP